MSQRKHQRTEAPPDARRWYETDHGIDKTRDLAAFLRLVNPRNEYYLVARDHKQDEREAWGGRIKNWIGSVGSQGLTYAKAKTYAVVAWLSHIAKDDKNDVWEDEDASELRGRAKDLRKGHEPREYHGFTQNYMTGRRLRARADDRIADEDTRTFVAYVIDDAALDAVEASDGEDVFFAVRHAAHRAKAFPDSVHATKVAEAQAKMNIVIAEGVSRNKAERARVMKNFDLIYDRMFEVEFGVDAEILRACDVRHARELDTNPRACLLGSKKCRLRKKVREKLFGSRQRAMRQEADGQKADFRKIVGKSGAKKCFARRFPKLAAYPDVIQAMADRVNYDHIFSAACLALRGNRPFFRLRRIFQRSSPSLYLRAGDHPMNMSRRRRRKYVDSTPSTRDYICSMAWGATRTTCWSPTIHWCDVHTGSSTSTASIPILGILIIWRGRRPIMAATL